MIAEILLHIVIYPFHGFDLFSLKAVCHGFQLCFCLQLNDVLQSCTSMVYSAAKGNPKQLSLNFKFFLPILLQNLQSPLAAPYMSNLFIDLRRIVFQNDSAILGELIAHVALRLLKPQCDLDAGWEEEDLTKAMVRTMGLIHEKTVTKKESDIDCQCFTAPAFCYMFVYLRPSLLSSYAKKHENYVNDGLQVISAHSKMRPSAFPDEKQLYHPKYLPIQQMFELLIELICK